MAALAPATSYTPHLDVLLLREVLIAKLHPESKGTQAIKKWQEIVDKINDKITPKEVSVRQTRDRAKRLMKIHKKGEAVSSRASGVDEEYDEREQLLTEWNELDQSGELVITFEDPKKEVKKAEDDAKVEQGKLIRKRAMESLLPRSTDSSDDEDAENLPPLPKLRKTPERKTPDGKAAGKQNKLHLMMDLMKVENDLRREELAIRREELKAENNRNDGMMQLLTRVLMEKKNT